MEILIEKVNHFDEITKNLAYAQLKTKAELQKFKNEMNTLKDE